MLIKKSIIISLLIIFCFYLHSWSALSYEDSLCAYTWQSDVNNCPDPLDCLELLVWNGEIKNIPLNVSRISPDSLKH